MPTCTAKIGPSIAPASAQSAAPSANTMVKSRRMFTPMATAISRFEAPARTSMPTLVLVTNRYKRTATTAPTPMIASR